MTQQQQLEMLQWEQQAYAAGYHAVCGVDEAGRGPLAGPVFAAAVILPPGRIIHRPHISLQYPIKLFPGISLPVQFLTGPDRVQIIPVAHLIQLPYSRLLLYQFIHDILIRRKFPEEDIPPRKPVALYSIQGRIHRHQIPKLVIHDKRPGNKMVHLIVFLLHGLFPKDIYDLRDIQNPVP